jgi:hypothetical protein
MYKILVSLIVVLSVNLAQAAEPSKSAEPDGSVKTTSTSNSSSTTQSVNNVLPAGPDKSSEPDKVIANSAAESVGPAVIKVVCHNKVKDGKPVMKDGKPEQECAKIKTRKKLEARDIPTVKK